MHTLFGITLVLYIRTHLSIILQLLQLKDRTALNSGITLQHLACSSKEIGSLVLSEGFNR